jgi:LysM repeat protein
VLTLEELRSYVDRFWPTATAVQVADENERFAGSEVNPAKLREHIRYLLGRRLTREFRGDQARAYYPAAWVESFDQLVAGLHKGWDETAPPRERAGALLQAAVIARTNGMELIGTEVAPDWHYHLGQFEEGVTGEHRDSNVLAVVVRPSNDELRRNAEHLPDPNERFHYRYQAARLAWEAAKLLPDNDNFTAHILWQGGSFLKHRDPEYADIFYKALVRRNRKTVLGAEADWQRWFPILDDNGNILPKERGAAAPGAQPELQPMEQRNANETSEPETSNPPTSAPGQPAIGPASAYVIRAGDSLASIAQAFCKAGVLVTVRDVFASNPGLDPAKLRVGQVIFIPAVTH